MPNTSLYPPSPSLTETDPDVIPELGEGISCDSRTLRAGEVFFAVPGGQTDGESYIPKALARGARAVVVERRGSGPVPTLSVPVFPVLNVRRALALASRRVWPDLPPCCVAVTGTNGKSSVVSFLRQIWTSLGRSSASVGTLGIVHGDRDIPLSHTTPSAPLLHGALQDLAHQGVSHVALEASSHGLDQYRLDGLTLKAAGFTQITRDHLDYHESFEAYKRAKLRLFEELLPEGALAVVHEGAQGADDVVALCRRNNREVMRIGTSPACDLILLKAEVDGFCQGLELEIFGKKYGVKLPLAGAFQRDNALLAATLAVALGEEPGAVCAALEGVTGVLGRCELVLAPNGERGAVFVDYAHTPDALETILKTLRPYTPAQLFVVFGCGGERDRGKRPQMGQIAHQYADHVVVTDDNPRHENPEEIRKEILKGCPSASEIADRARAITWVLEQMGPEDIAVIAGKGHETGQMIEGQRIPFSDHDVLRRVRP